MPSLAVLEVVLARMAPAEIAIIEPFLLPSVRRARRLAARDKAIRAVAVHYPEYSTGRGLATALHRDLQRYAAAGWRFERDRPPVGRRQAAGLACDIEPVRGENDRCGADPRDPCGPPLGFGRKSRPESSHERWETAPTKWLRQ